MATIVEKEKREGKRVEADLVTWRGMMTKVSYDLRHFREADGNSIAVD